MSEGVQSRPPSARVRPASIPDGIVTVEDHLESILRGVGTLAPYDQPVVESLGLPVHDDIVAAGDLPRFSHAAADGYALLADDLVGATAEDPAVLPVVADLHAGSDRPFAISQGTAVRIAAGAPMPRGADVVVPRSATQDSHNRVRIFAPVPAGNAVRAKGDDVRQGETVLAAGSVLGPREIGLLASLGMPRISARPRPRVVILATGSELREPGTDLDFDSVNDGTSFMLAAAAKAVGAVAYRVGVVPDDPRVFRQVLSEQLVRADLVVTTGGIDDGDREVVRQTLAPLDTVTFTDVAIDPGSRQGFGTVFDEQTPIITLPGEPAAAYIGFEVFVLPALRRLMGRTPYRRPMVHAVLASGVRGEPGSRQYVPATFEVTHRGAKVTPVEDAAAHRIGRLARANALVVIGEDETALNLGDTVRVLVLDRPF